MNLQQQLNAYLDWRAQREGREVDVSAEAYQRHLLVDEIILEAESLVSRIADQPQLTWGALSAALADYDELTNGDNNA